MAQQRRSGLEALVVPGLVGQVAEQVPEPTVGEAHPAVLTVDPAAGDPPSRGVVKFPTTKCHVINFALGLRGLAETVSVMRAIV